MIRYAALLLASIIGSTPGQAQTAPPSSTTKSQAGVPVRDGGLVGTWYPPSSGKRGPALLVLGGSEGGEQGGRVLGRALAAEGYGVLSLAYFRAQGLPPTLQNIPLEYFDRALAWLARQPLADPKRLGIYGISVGGETALAVASRRPELRAVVAAVPSSVIWQGFDPANYRSIQSTYSVNGTGVPYLPYDTSVPFTGVYALYANSLQALSKHPDAVISVERIGGAVLLLSAKSDTVWPSSEMSEQVVARLKAHGFARPYRHVAYADAGHAAMLPPEDGPARNGGYDNLGGTEAGNAAARAGMWKETVAFLAENVGAVATWGKRKIR